MNDLHIGDLVLIKNRHNNPEFWDSDGSMFSLIGKAFKITKVLTTGRFRLEGLQWTWRSVDLVLLVRADGTQDKFEPNHRFKLRKKGLI